MGQSEATAEHTLSWEIRQGDALERLREMPNESVQCCITSPPYFGMRDYDVAGQIGREASLQKFVASLVAVFAEVRRVLRTDGTLWLNLGDSYGPDKNLFGVPWTLAFALRADGWILRSDIIWAKPNALPDAATDRPTNAHEHIFLLSKRRSYYYDAAAIREASAPSVIKRAEAGYLVGGKSSAPERNDPERFLKPFIANGRNKRSVWWVAVIPYGEAHFAAFPPKLIEPCVLAGSAEGDTILDPFCGSGTTGLVALRHSRSFIGVELNPAYVELARRRITDDAPLLNSIAEVAA